MRKTGVIFTYGPSVSDSRVLKKMLASADGIRLNFSHMKRGEIKGLTARIRKIESELDAFIPVFGDISGTKIRLKYGGEPKKGDILRLSPEDLNIPEIIKFLKPGERVLIDDGKIAGKIRSLRSGSLSVAITCGGILPPNKGISFPDSKLEIPCISKKDIEDIEEAALAGVDFLFLSFVNKADDITGIKKAVHALRSDIPVIAKIETKNAVKNIKKIIECSDGILIARGDLGSEMRTEEVPIIQKTIVKMANEAGKLTFVATGILDSMIKSGIPLRAEVADISNMVEEEVDAVMVTSETSIGEAPLKVLEVLNRVLKKSEAYYDPRTDKSSFVIKSLRFSRTKAIARSIYTNSEENDARAIINVTNSGETSLFCSKYRPTSPIFAVSDSAVTLRRCRIMWNVRPLFIKNAQKAGTDRIIEEAGKRIRLKAGDIVLISKGFPEGAAGNTNSFSVFTVKRKGPGNSKNPGIDSGLCVLCGKCVNICPFGIFYFDKGIIRTRDHEKCIKDGLCTAGCPVKAVKI